MNRSHLTLTWSAAACAAGVVLSGLAGCQAPSADQTSRKPHGYIWYLDGAGGGGLKNYGGGLKKGMLAAGYAGGGEIFSWNTGLGVVADQTASDSYKRKKAGELAAEIQAYKRTYPNGPVNLIGLSAGTALTVFTLEALPTGCPVDNVVLLGASISADYNLTKALERVKGELYIFTSENDAVLRFLVPIGGTADRTSSKSAGLTGFRAPSNPSAETHRQYQKVSQVPWRKEFESKGNYGGHTDSVNAKFVQAYVAPLLIRGSKGVAMASSSKHVDNPDYIRWSKFGIGSWVRMDAVQTVDGQDIPIEVTETLISRTRDQLIVERVYTLKAGDHASEERSFYLLPKIDPSKHPLTNPNAQVTKQPIETMTIKGVPMKCDVLTVKADGDYPEWGRDVSGTVHLNMDLPGGVAKLTMQATSSRGIFKFEGVVADYYIQK